MIRSIQNSLRVMVPSISAMVVHPKEQDRLQALVRRAIQENNLPLAKQAIEQGAPINRQDIHANDGHNDYHLVRAAYYRTNDIAKLLINSGANVNVSCEHGHTPLIVSSSFGRRNHPLIHSLLLANANVHQRDGEGKTALMEAAFSHDLHTVYMLIRAGARLDDRDNDGKSPLFFALQFTSLFSRVWSLRSVETIKKLIDSSSVNVADNQGVTPLMLAASHGQVLIAEMLIAAGADRSVQNNLGQTALGFAQTQKKEKEQLIQKYDCIISLLENAPGSTERPEEGPIYNFTRLGSAIHFNQIDEVKKYIDEGDDIHEMDHSGPKLTEAARRGHLA